MEPTATDERTPSGLDATALAAGIAHELRNPLSTMMVNLKLLAEDLEDEGADPHDARRRALQKVDVLRREARQLQSLCEDFLNLVAPRRLQREPTDVNQIVARLAEFFELLAKGHGITLEALTAPGPLICPADANLLRQAVLNLMINAQQAMPDGGRLEIATGVEDDSVVVRVSDTGVGIAPEERDRVMEPFFSTKSGGTGLGLAITRRIVEEHGGTMGFESQPGQGTTFTIRLPGVQQDAGVEQGKA